MWKKSNNKEKREKERKNKHKLRMLIKEKREKG